MAIRQHVTLPPALTGERIEIAGRAGRVSFYRAGEGAPVLLLHSINAAGSAYEVRPIHERMRTNRRVYSPDLPGFGFSDRADRDYTIRLYVDAVHDMLDLIEQENGDSPIDVIALSLASEFIARAIVERTGGRAGRVRSLTLVTPTGFMRGSDRLRGPTEASREVPALYRLFTFPLWSQGVYDLLVSRKSIRFFLKRTYGSDAIDEAMLDYDYLTTHQPGAKNAPYAFVSARLFSKDIRTVYERLELPIWVPHATRGDFKDFSESGWAKARPNWTFTPFDAGALPHFEQPDVFMTMLAQFLAKVDGTSGAGRAVRGLPDESSVR